MNNAARLRRLVLGVMAAVATLAFLGLSPGPAQAGTAAPAAVNAATQHYSYRAFFNQNSALSVGAFGSPINVFRYDLQFGISDWRKEATINGFRLHSRFYRDNGLDYCLAASGTSVFEEQCSANVGTMRQNWRMEISGSAARLRHSGTGLYLTYPSSGTGNVTLGAFGSITTQGFLERSEGIK